MFIIYHYLLCCVCLEIYLISFPNLNFLLSGRNVYSGCSLQWVKEKAEDAAVVDVFLFNLGVVKGEPHQHQKFLGLAHTRE